MSVLTHLSLSPPPTHTHSLSFSLNSFDKIPPLSNPSFLLFSTSVPPLFPHIFSSSPPYTLASPTAPNPSSFISSPSPSTVGAADTGPPTQGWLLISSIVSLGRGSISREGWREGGRKGSKGYYTLASATSSYEQRLASVLALPGLKPSVGGHAVRHIVCPSRPPGPARRRQPLAYGGRVVAVLVLLLRLNPQMQRLPPSSWPRRARRTE